MHTRAYLDTPASARKYVPQTLVVERASASHVGIDADTPAANPMDSQSDAPGSA
jgi:hypothetical protein